VKRRRVPHVLALIGLDGTKHGPRGAQLLPEDLRLELREIQALQISRVGQHLGDDRAPRFRVRGQLDLDDDQPPGRFDSQQVSVAVTEAHLTAKDRQTRRSCQRQHLRGVAHQVVQFGLREVGRRCEREPTPARVSSPYSGHRRRLDPPDKRRQLPSGLQDCFCHSAKHFRQHLFECQSAVRGAADHVAYLVQ
jgi:hypothetical protein